MIARGTGAFAILLGSLLFFAMPPAPADAASSSRTASAHRSAPAHASRATTHRTAHRVVRRSSTARGKARAVSSGGLQCVPYARSLSGIQISGNAHTWWNQAKGVYERGHKPEKGAVMSFRSTSRMRLGHVAVVSRVLGPREVLIDHANWAGPRGRKGLISRGVSVVDVSPANDWTSVRVSIGNGAYGSVYPTNGFIYARADGTDRAYAAGTAPRTAGTVATATARALAGEPVRFEEIAEAQAQQRRR